MDTEQAVTVFFRLVEAVILPLSLYIANKISSLERKVDKVDTVLIGVDGKNGLRSRIRRLEVKVDKLSLLQAARHGEVPDIYDKDDEDDD